MTAELTERTKKNKNVALYQLYGVYLFFLDLSN